MMPMTERFAAGIRRYIDTPRLDLVADPRDALTAAQAEQIAVLETLVADLRKRLHAPSGQDRATAGTPQCRRRRMTCRGGNRPGSSGGRRSARRRSGGSSRAARARR